MFVLTRNRLSPSSRRLMLLLSLFLMTAGSFPGGARNHMAASAAFLPPPQLVLFPAPVRVEPSAAGGDWLLLDAAADFFAEAFWAAKARQPALEPRQRRAILSSQRAEFRRRYGGSGGGSARTRSAELLIATRNGSAISNNSNGDNSNDIIGCCGIEVDTIPENGLQGRRLTTAPLMSNVAVGRKARRRGVAQRLVQRAEDLARKEWGYAEVYLYVEKRNTPAVRLYRKLGYRTLWEDETATTLVPLKNGSMNQVPTTLICMKKDLNRGFWGRIFPF